jgi:CubicO group peptidase (beta-lactamase class C family)
MIAKIKNQTLKDAFFQIMVEAGLRDTTFHPSTPLYQIVPGGYNQGVCRGIPYNKYAHFMDYMAGNSGLFSTADNLVRLMQLLLNKGKMPL